MDSRTMSLASFDGGDPDLYLAVVFIEQREPGQGFPPLSPDEVVLAEYPLPAARPPWLPPR
ncbi:hypothetical protein [Gordonia crocea]|uniref:hypothetical protein n=1 Tax=Gordonia crocea TaxID=589162 RepID=UPI0013796452|nr:hypothetical protein [Gordonia crocea]